MKPWMHQSEIDMIVSYLKPTHSMFEWGCGGSTVFFSRYVKSYRSIEHDIVWYDNISMLISPTSNIDLVHIDNKDNYKNYVNAISLYHTKYDAILVDGRERVRCSISSKQYLKDTGILFIHDFFKRPRYLPVLDHYHIIDGIRSSEQTLAVLKKND